MPVSDSPAVAKRQRTMNGRLVAFLNAKSNYTRNPNKAARVKLEKAHASYIDSVYVYVREIIRSGK
jgi:hypothetical protein